MFYKVVLDSESVDEILKCDHLNQTFFSSSPVFPQYFSKQNMGFVFPEANLKVKESERVKTKTNKEV